MAGTHSQFPESLDVLDRLADGQSYGSADLINIMADAARQMQVALGANLIAGNLPAGSASDWATITTIQPWLQRFFRMEFGTFEIKLPIAADSGSLNSDYTVYYRNPQRFDHESTGSANNIPHWIGVSFDQVGSEIQGAIAQQPNAHVNRVYNTSTNEILGFTLRNNDPWGDKDKYTSNTITGKYWAFEPQYHS